MRRAIPDRVVTDALAMRENAANYSADGFAADWYAEIAASEPIATKDLRVGMFVFDPKYPDQLRPCRVEEIRRVGVYRVRLLWTWGTPDAPTPYWRTASSAQLWLRTHEPTGATWERLLDYYGQVEEP